MLQQLSLSGAWSVTQKNRDDTFAATVPGDIYHDLLKAGKIDDPFYRDNELEVLWVGDVDWVYSRTFDVSAALLSRECVLLRCEGLDTVATIKINGKKLAATNNAFRTYEFDAKTMLKAGENTIEVTFVGSVKAAKQAVRTLGSQCAPTAPEGVGLEMPARNYLRKMQCQTGWDWGIRLPGVGIWKEMSLVAFDGARIDGVLVSQEHRKNTVNLTVTTECDAASRGKRSAKVSVRSLAFEAGKKDSSQTERLCHVEMSVKGKKAVAEITIDDPKLWWPNGLGDQPLYTVEVELCDADGTVIDTHSQRIGLRTVELVEKEDKWGESFYFTVNGVPFFAKGANWIPGDAIYSRMTEADYRRLLEDSTEANMNMMRVWGGGIYEADCFYDLCDELGIFVWQDFMFACAAYPMDNEAYVESVRLEAVDNVRRLRNHACIALWCGNNEIEMCWFTHSTITEWTNRAMPWAFYKPVFDKLLPTVLRQQGATQNYIPSSAYSPGKLRNNPNGPHGGDSHMWAVWHGKEPFEFYRTCEHRFQSEYGFQAFPEPKTVYGYTTPEDRNVTSPVMEHHQRSRSGNSLIFGQMCDRFRMPSNFDNTLWLSQIQQAFAIQYAVDHFRRQRPQCMGSLYWQLNDNWPIASWSSIDYHGRWKALHYLAKRFYAPVSLSILEDIEKGRADVWLCSDVLEPTKGHIVWNLVDANGESVATGKEPAEIAANKSKRALRLELADVLKNVGADNVVLFADFVVSKEVVSSNIATFVRIKRIEFADPKITTAVNALKNGSFEVTLTSAAPALFTWVVLKDADSRCSDNFFHLEPGTKTVITLTPEKTMPQSQVEKQLIVQSLRNTYL